MGPTENLYYAIGQLAYAVAKADGEIQKEERQRFETIIAVGLRAHDVDLSISDIIFHILNEDNSIKVPEAYECAMREIRTNSHYLSPKLKQCFIKIIEEIAEAFPPVTAEERELVNKFKRDIEPIVGDPVYYQ
jgi:uncharacterized tellurite resistance protein B-like protein